MSGRATWRGRLAFTQIATHPLSGAGRAQIKLDRGKSVSTLEVDIEIPNGFGAALAKAS
jgi:hypothetical protein